MRLPDQSFRNAELCPNIASTQQNHISLQISVSTAALGSLRGAFPRPHWPEAQVTDHEAGGTCSKPTGEDAFMPSIVGREWLQMARSVVKVTSAVECRAALGSAGRCALRYFASMSANSAKPTSSDVCCAEKADIEAVCFKVAPGAVIRAALQATADISISLSHGSRGCDEPDSPALPIQRTGRG